MSQLNSLKLGERLLIQRRRLGETQAQAAKRHGISRKLYGRCERHHTGGPEGVVRVGRLRPYERCLLYRRRTGQTQIEVSRRLECSRFWVNQMERGEVSCDDLLWYWEH